MTVSQELRELPPEYLNDPAEVYRKLREVGPVHHVVMPSGMRAWMITDYEHARQALADPALSKDNEGAAAIFTKQAEEQGTARLEFAPDLAAHMLNTDPPDHNRLRKQITRAFTLRAVQRLEPKIERIAAKLLDDMAGKAEVDLLEDFAFPLPITVICELLGVPEGDRGEFRGWTTTMFSARPEDRARLPEISAALAGYLAKLIADKRANPAEDILSALIETADDGDRLSESELISMAFLLLVAGHETTVNLIGNGVLALLRNPDQLALLRTDPTLMAGAVEEFLRYEGPLNTATFRHTTAPYTVGDVTIGANEFVVVSLLAANRDPNRYADPDSLDITRPTGGHVAFGHGIHFCVGAPLARLEGQIAIRALLERFPALALAREPRELEWRNSVLMRGLVDLPVRLA